MIVSLEHSRSRLRLIAAMGLVACGLGGCAGMSDSMTTAFADPSKYELYECKHLETERKTLAARLADLQRLMAKAETGTGGVVIAELAYRNEYIAVRGQSQFAEEAWQRNRCVAGAPAVAPAPVPPVVAPAPNRAAKR